MGNEAGGKLVQKSMEFKTRLRYRVKPCLKKGDSAGGNKQKGEVGEGGMGGRDGRATWEGEIPGKP